MMCDEAEVEVELQCSPNKASADPPPVARQRGQPFRAVSSGGTGIGPLPSHVMGHWIPAILRRKHDLTYARQFSSVEEIPIQG